MEKVMYTTLLYDMYGSLLTKHQQNVFEMYYFQDFSLQEICETIDVSRQAVSDLLNRTVKKLENYEDVLQLLLQHTKQEKIGKEIYTLLDELKNESSDILLEEKIDKIKSLLALYRE